MHPITAGTLSALRLLGFSSSRAVGWFLWWGQSLDTPGSPGIQALLNPSGSILARGGLVRSKLPTRSREERGCSRLYHEHKDYSRPTPIHTYTLVLTHRGLALGCPSGTGNDTQTDPSPQAPCVRVGPWARAELRSIQSLPIRPDTGAAQTDQPSPRLPSGWGLPVWEAGAPCLKYPSRTQMSCGPPAACEPHLYATV